MVLIAGGNDSLIEVNSAPWRLRAVVCETTEHALQVFAVVVAPPAVVLLQLERR